MPWVQGARERVLEVVDRHGIAFVGGRTDIEAGTVSSSTVLVLVRLGVLEWFNRDDGLYVRRGSGPARLAESDSQGEGQHGDG